ncbi:hypothetical protein [Archaeoglobus sulfaticallidus]|uniref:hypothetical protein n=1 Tax=Archaeoglobus sulfaticallidus TaxID=1316941 RepID=UPI00064EC62C|nr:hypothetical protein [Archaeoglobus sulfaticallidus]
MGNAFEMAATAISPLVNISCENKNSEAFFSRGKEARKQLLTLYQLFSDLKSVNGARIPTKYMG